jgi:hypothetical protein
MSHHGYVVLKLSPHGAPKIAPNRFGFHPQLRDDQRRTPPNGYRSTPAVLGQGSAQRQPNRSTNFFASTGPMPFTKPLARYRSTPPLVGWWNHLQDFGFELQTMLFIPNPPAFRSQPFPCAHGRQRTEDLCRIPLPSNVHAEHDEAALRVEEREPRPCFCCA